MATHFVILSAITVLLMGLTSVTIIYATNNQTESERVENVYFSINIPDSWTYVEYSSGIQLAPNEFTDVLQASLEDPENTVGEGVLSIFTKDIDYVIKNAPLESYVKYLINELGITNITSQKYVTVGGEKAVRLSSNESEQWGNVDFTLYLVMHDKEPYKLEYGGIPNNIYEKYLPEFEEIVKSFTFADSPSGTKNLSENENITDTTTNFSSVIPYSERPYIGIVGVSLAPEFSKEIGLNQTKGFLLTSITEGSPAEKVDLRAGAIPKMFNGREINTGGDIILKIDNKEVLTIDDIMKYVQSQKQVGDKVKLTILRDNETRQVDLILEETPSELLQNGNGNYPDELYDECVGVAGKSFCDFLFKR
jgi:hypothetical protein